MKQHTEFGIQNSAYLTASEALYFAGFLVDFKMVLYIYCLVHGDCDFP